MPAQAWLGEGSCWSIAPATQESQAPGSSLNSASKLWDKSPDLLKLWSFFVCIEVNVEIKRNSIYGSFVYFKEPCKCERYCLIRVPVIGKKVANISSRDVTEIGDCVLLGFKGTSGSRILSLTWLGEQQWRGQEGKFILTEWHQIPGGRPVWGIGRTYRYLARSYKRTPGMWEKVVPGITALSSAPSDSLNVKEVSKNRKGEAWQGESLLKPIHGGQKINVFI